MDDLSPGDMLRLAREKAGLDQNRVATEINTSLNYVAALEMDDLDAFPSLTYYKGFLRIYVDYLGLDFNLVMEQLEILQQQRAPLPSELLKRPSRWKSWWWVLLALAILAAASAAYWWVF